VDAKEVMVPDEGMETDVLEAVIELGDVEGGEDEVCKVIIRVLDWFVDAVVEKLVASAGIPEMTFLTYNSW